MSGSPYYSATVPTLTEGFVTSPRVDVNGRLIVVTDATVNTTSPGVQTSTAGMTPVLPELVYNTVAPVLANTNTVDAQCDVNGNLKTREQYAPGAEDNTLNVLCTHETPLAVSTYGTSSIASTVLETGHVLKTSAGNLYEIHFQNENAAARYLQIFNSTTVPADATVPVFVVKVAAGASYDRTWPKGMFFSTGIAVCNSSTAATKTVGAADSWFNAEIK